MSLDDETLTLLGSKDAFAAKLTELSRATAVSKAAEAAANSRIALAEERERTANNAASKLEGNQSQYAEKRATLDAERRAFTEQLVTAKAEMAKREAAVTAREKAVEQPEKQFADRDRKLIGKEREAQAAAEESRRVIAAYADKVKRVQAIFAET